MSQDPEPPSQPQREPLFQAIAQSDSALQAAYRLAAATIDHFIRHIQSNPEAGRLAKLRFRDPDGSERTGEDCFLFLWLCDVFYYPEENHFTGMFF